MDDVQCLKRMKNQFSDFYFSSYRDNSSKIGVMTRILGRKKYIQFFFFFFTNLFLVQKCSNIFEEKKKFNFFLLGASPPTKKHPGSGIFFLGLADPSRIWLVSTAYQKKPGSSVHRYATSK